MLKLSMARCNFYVARKMVALTEENLVATIFFRQIGE